jgi:hypothetical protein
MKPTPVLAAFVVVRVSTAGPATAVQEADALECADQSIAVLSPPLEVTGCASA